MSNTGSTTGVARAKRVKPPRVWRIVPVALAIVTAAAVAACQTTTGYTGAKIGTKTPTKVPTSTAVPPPTATPPYGSMSGVVLHSGTPWAGRQIRLEGSDDCLGFPTAGPIATSDPSGAYGFTGLHTLAPGQAGGLRVIAFGTPSAGEMSWMASTCVTPVALVNIVVPPLDLLDVTLGSQPPFTGAPDPCTFEYFGRPGLYYEQYEIYIWDPVSGYFWASPLLPWAWPGTYTATQAAMGVVTSTQYRWTLRVHDANGGIGQGGAFRTVIF